MASTWVANSRMAAAGARHTAQESKPTNRTAADAQPGAATRPRQVARCPGRARSLDRRNKLPPAGTDRRKQQVVKLTRTIPTLGATPEKDLPRCYRAQGHYNRNDLRSRQNLPSTSLLIRARK